MKLRYAIRKKFPDSKADRFCVWDDDCNRLFDSDDFVNDDYDSKLTDCEVLEMTVSCGPYGRNSVMSITIDTGARERRELIAAVKKIQAHCERVSQGGTVPCTADRCPYWQDYCILKAESPLGWDLNDQPGTS